jgi:predicted permease
MPDPVWRLVEWQLSRHVPARHLGPVLGDLTEDLGRRQQAVGRIRATMWLLGEARSLVVAYRLQSRHHQPGPGALMSIFQLDDVRLAIRRLVKRPGASLASIVTLACAIGAATATWSLLSAVLLHPLPVTAPDRLMAVGARVIPRNGRPPGSPSFTHLYPTYQTVTDSGAFERVAASGSPGANWTELVLVSPQGVPMPRVIYFASHNYFETLGVPLAVGPGFREEDDRPGAALTAVLSDRFWRTELDADPRVVGRTMSVAGRPATIVGVTPRRFRGLNLTTAPDVYLPLNTIGDVASADFNFFARAAGPTMSSPTAWVTIVGRLRPGADAPGTEARLNHLPDDGRQRTFVLLDVNTASIPEPSRAGMAQFGRLLGITVGLLLLIGCLTVGMLLLIRTEARRDEFAMCLALGATRARLTRGIAVESALLAISGAVLAVPVAWQLFFRLRAFQLPGNVDVDYLDLSIDTGALLAAAAAATMATLLIALVAAVLGFSGNVADVLRSRSGATSRLGRRRTRAVLVTAQVAVALVLLSGAGLLGRSLVAALNLNPGFETSRLVTGGIGLRPYGYTPDRATAFFDDLAARLSQNAAIRSFSTQLFQGGMSPAGKITVDGVPRQFPSTVSYIAVDERYFTTIGLRVVAGRDFTATDTATAPPVVIVSQSFGRLLADGADPIGHRITEGHNKIGQPAAVVDVVGVVPDLITSVSNLEPLVMYYALAQQDASTGRSVAFRASTDATSAIRELMNTIHAIDPVVMPPAMMTIDERIGRQMGPQKLGAVVLGALGVIAMLLTVLGAYVLAESMAVARKREIGIRAALGATRKQLGAVVLKETCGLVGLGIVIGLGMAWLGAGTIRAFLFRVQPLDPVTLVSVAASIMVLTLAVTLRPAVDAARVDLAEVLRQE